MLMNTMNKRRQEKAVPIDLFFLPALLELKFQEHMGTLNAACKGRTHLEDVRRLSARHRFTYTSSVLSRQEEVEEEMELL